MTLFFLSGINPEPWTAPEASVGRKNGGTFVQMHKTESLRAYQEAIREEFAAQNPHWGGHPVIGEGKQAKVTFYLWRQLQSYEIGDGRRSQRNIADATNCQKSLEDALQGILYANDRCIADIRTVIVSQDQHTEPHIVIEILETVIGNESVPGIILEFIKRQTTKVAKIVGRDRTGLSDDF